MTSIILAYALGIITGALGLLGCQERRDMKRRMGYPTRERSDSQMPRQPKRKTLCAWCTRAMRCKTREETDGKPVSSCYKFRGRHPEPERIVPQPEGIAIIEGRPLWSGQEQQAQRQR